MKGKIRTKLNGLVCLIVFGSCLAYTSDVSAFTPPLETSAQITYPISLSTGQDATGKLIFPDKNFWEYICQETFQTGSYAGYPFDLDEDGMLSREECETVRVLSISGRKDITSLKGIEAFPKLRELYCPSTGITEIDVSNNPRLQKLICSGTAITALDVSACSQLKELKLSGCGLTNLDLRNNPMLTFLTCQAQTRPAYEYIENGTYKVELTDWDKTIDLSRVSDVTIDGAPGDGINSGYNAQTGTIYCSDQIRTVSYTYEVNLGEVEGESIDTRMSVTLTLKQGLREVYETSGGTKILPQYIENGSKDTEPEPPEKEGYCFTGWYTRPDTSVSSRWIFGTALSSHQILYAGWQKKKYKVRYEIAGGTFLEAEKEMTADWWTTGLLPQRPPTKDGFILIGWKTESGQILTAANADTLTYGQASGNSRYDSTTLTAQWEVVSGYKLAYATGSSAVPEDQIKNLPEERVKIVLSWDSTGLIPELEPSLPGHRFTGWYTALQGGIKVTETTTYGELYRTQFTGAQTNQIPTLYAQFEKKQLSIVYDERGGSSVADRIAVPWGSRNLLPATKTKKKNYLFAGWKCNGRKVTKKTTTNQISDGYEDSITLTAVWYKKYEKKGMVFKRYGCWYKVTKSDKKGNKIRLIRTSKKRVILRNKIFYNGKYFTVSGIREKALKRKKVVLCVPKKKWKKYQRMAKRAGGRIKKK